MAQAVLGIIGGSGLYEFEALTDRRWETVSSPFGEPSDQLLFGTFGDQQLVFLPRHGRGHVLPPSEINYRANIDALKRAGVTDVLSLSAVGSFRDELAPGHFVLVDQFVDRTFARHKSFFGAGCVAHVTFSHPVSARLQDALEDAGRSLGLVMHRGGVYLCMEGPQFSTYAESMLYRSWGCDVIGMTNMPEAKLAREAELPYATVAMVTDYDCWHPDHDSVSVEAIIGVMMANADNARALVAEVAPRLAERPEVDLAGGDRALDTAIVTRPDMRDPELLAKLDAVAGRVLG